LARNGCAFAARRRRQRIQKQQRGGQALTLNHCWQTLTQGLSLRPRGRLPTAPDDTGSG